MSDERVFSCAAVLGTGAWGTTFAQVLADAGMDVRMWGRNSAVVDFISSGENASYLPGIELSDRISATTELASVLKGAQLIVVAVPVAAVRPSLASAREHLAEDAVLLSLAKGLEPETLLRVDEIIAQAAGADASRIAVLSGPNLSREIAEHHPTATVIASADERLAASLAKACRTSYFRPYASTDVIGSEIAGAAKNVIAVAIGAAEGMGFGANTRATLITRGLAEITRLGAAVGADPQTFAGLAGIGDLMATCSSRLSRNFSFGHRIGQGMSVEEALSLSPGVVEGARSAEPLLALAASLGVDMPITGAVVSVVRDGASAEQMGEMLLKRPQKMDGWRIELL